MVNIIIKEYSSDDVSMNNCEKKTIDSNDNHDTSLNNALENDKITNDIYDLFDLEYDGEYKNDDELNFCGEDSTIAMFLHYETNYTVKSLKLIAQFYNLEHRKLKKENLINIIVEFELNSENYYEVIERRNLWKCWKKLSTHKFFDNKLLEKI